MMRLCASQLIAGMQPLFSAMDKEKAEERHKAEKRYLNMSDYNFGEGLVDGQQLDVENEG